MEPQRMPGTARVINVRQNDLTARARAAADVAKSNAAAVDAEARFPSESFAEIRKQRLLGLQVPTALGGEGASIAEIADVCYILGQACSSTALIYAMHQIKMACITRHAKGNAALDRILGRIAAEQLLMASSTTEAQAGGNVRPQRGRRRARCRTSHAGTQGHGHSLCRGSGWHGHHRPPFGRRRRLR